MAMQTGMIQIVGTINPTKIMNSMIYSDVIVSYNTTIADIDNVNVCINLCFASDGYVEYLSSHRNLMGDLVIFT